jgi:hypothetical protein
MRGHNPAVPDIEYLLEQLDIARKDATAAHKALELACYADIRSGKEAAKATPEYWLKKAQEGTA